MKTNSSLLLLLSALTLNFNCMANDSKGATGADEITRPQRAAVKVVQTAGRTALGDFAPEFAHLNDDILFVRSGAVTTFFHFATAVWLL